MQGKVIVIVGATGGIGSACAKLFGKAKAKLVLVARDTEKAQNIADEVKESGGEAIIKELDVTKPEQAATVAKEVEEEWGKIDALVNAFGQGLIQSFDEINPEDAKEIIDVNVFGTFVVTQAFKKHMKEDEPTSVVMFPGTMGKYVMKNASVYAASKFAIQGMTKALIEEQRRGKTKYSLLYLGGVDTPFWDDDRVQMKVKKDMMLNTDDVAKAVYYTVNQPSGSVMNEVVIQPESHQLV